MARALINNPYLILADEPTATLDSNPPQRVIKSFKHAQKELAPPYLW